MINFVICPKCQRRINLEEDFGIDLDKINIREKEIQCTSGHSFSVFDGLLASGLNPNHYNIFWPIQGMETGEEHMKVGQWRIVKPKKKFEEIDEVQTIFFSEDETDLTNVRTEARFRSDTPKEFCLMTSGEENEWGKNISVNWIVYGIIPNLKLEIWRENLTFAARQLLAANYRPCVIQSAVAVESFVYDFVITYLKNINWDSRVIRDYVEGASIGSLPVQGLIKIFVQEVMRIDIPNDVFAGWMRLKNLRDTLAHGDIVRYTNLSDLSGNKFINDELRAKFAYQAAVRFIYELRYPLFDD